LLIPPESLSPLSPMKTFLSFAVMFQIAAFYPRPILAQDHSHLNVGAVDTTQGAALFFENGPDFATNSSYVNTLTFTNAGRYAGYHVGNITLTVLPATEDYGGPVPNAPAPGSRIFAQLMSVDGPVGGAFAFWETGATTPTITVSSGTTGTNLFLLSQNDGSPGTDPYGHIHGRRFTATKPGIYLVTVRALDLSTNGLNGGPIHEPSEPLRIYFQAGANIKSILTSHDGARLICGAKSGWMWQLEAKDDVGSPTWNPMGEPFPGSDHFVEITDPQPPTGQRFYRLRGSP
jgi:hypothetical protein